MLSPTTSKIKDLYPESSVEVSNKENKESDNKAQQDVPKEEKIDVEQIDSKAIQETNLSQLSQKSKPKDATLEEVSA